VGDGLEHAAVLVDHGFGAVLIGQDAAERGIGEPVDFFPDALDELAEEVVTAGIEPGVEADHDDSPLEVERFLAGGAHGREAHLAELCLDIEHDLTLAAAPRAGEPGDEAAGLMLAAVEEQVDQAFDEATPLEPVQDGAIGRVAFHGEGMERIRHGAPGALPVYAAGVGRR
jgi:hypothetical protein